MRSTRSAIVLFVLLGLGMPIGCGGKTTSDKSLSFVDPVEAEKLLQDNRIFPIGGARRSAWVDPRGESAYRAGHIPGAIHMPLARARQDHATLKDYERLIVYGDDFNSVLARAMSKMLIELGHDVSTLRGGLRAWQDAGNRVAISDGDG